MGKSMPVRTATVRLDGDYEGFEVQVRTNTSWAVKQDLASGDEARVVGALKTIIHGWNLTDEDGTALPTPKNGCDLLTAVPDEVLAAIINGYVGAIEKAAELPKA